MYGFQSYGFLPESRVMAAAGETFANATDYIDVVQTLQPDVLYFSYGINDLGLQLGGDAQGYADFVETQVKALLEVSPDSLVVINSIIEATAEANTQSDYWSLAPEYNEALKTMTEKNGWIYVDNSTLSGGGTADIYQADGIHFYSTFYPVWAQHMLEAAKDALLNS
jgi:lysophospholipase L1-like esterase